MKELFSTALKLLVGDAKDLPKINLPSLINSKKRPLKTITERELITLESEVGSKLFGEVPKGRRREFFCLDEKTWIWYEQWQDEAKKTHETTVRYEVQDQGILKVQEGARYSYVEGEELRNLIMAMRLYYERVARQVYGKEPQPLV